MNPHKPLVRNYKKAIPLMLIGAVFLTLQAVCVKLVSPEVNSSVLVFTRGFVCLIAVLLFGCFTSSIRNFGELFKSKHVGKQLIRSAFEIAGVYGFFISLRMISLTNATVLLLTMPIFVPIASRILLKTRIPPKMWIGLSIAFVGVICIIRPGVGIFNIGALIGLIGAALGAVSMLAIRQLLHHGEPAPRIMVYVSICLSVVGLTAALLTPQTYTIAFTDEVLFYLLIVGSVQADSGLSTGHFLTDPQFFIYIQ